MLTLTEAKSELRLFSGTDFDALVTDLVAAVREAIEGWCNRKFGAQPPSAVKQAARIILRHWFAALDMTQTAPAVPSWLPFPAPAASLLSACGYKSFADLRALPVADDPIVRGMAWERTWTLYHDDQSTPVNLTGAAVRWSLYRADAWGRVGAEASSPASPDLTFSAAPQMTITSEANGVVDLALVDTDTQLIVPGLYWFRFSVTSPAGVTRIWEESIVDVVA